MQQYSKQLEKRTVYIGHNPDHSPIFDLFADFHLMQSHLSIYPRLDKI